MMKIQPPEELEQVFFRLPQHPERSLDVVGLGSNAVDWILRVSEFPKHGGKLRLRSCTRLAGGQTATATALCARYGLRVRYVGRVGDDEEGRFMQTTMALDTLDLSCLEVVEGGTSHTAFVLVDDRGERTILWERDPRLAYRPEEIHPEAIQAGLILHMDSHNLPACVEAAHQARSAGMKVSLDVDRVQPGISALLSLTDFLVPTLSFARAYTGEEDATRALLLLDQSVPEPLVATDGSRGCLAVWKGRIFQIPGFSVTPVDTTGAGDVFHGAFLFSLFQDWSLAQRLRFANAAAALSTTRLGSRGGIPQRWEVDDLLES